MSNSYLFSRLAELCQVPKGIPRSSGTLEGKRETNSNKGEDKGLKSDHYCDEHTAQFPNYKSYFFHINETHLNASMEELERLRNE